MHRDRAELRVFTNLFGVPGYLFSALNALPRIEISLSVRRNVRRNARSRVARRTIHEFRPTCQSKSWRRAEGGRLNHCPPFASGAETGSPVTWARSDSLPGRLVAVPNTRSLAATDCTMIDGG